MMVHVRLIEPPVAWPPAGTGFDDPVRAAAFLTQAVPAQQSGGGRPPDRRLRTERSTASVCGAIPEVALMRHAAMRC